MRTSGRRPGSAADHYSAVFVDSAPVPPHERPWRHPSELAADHRAAVVAERPSRSSRALALITGALGIAVVGVAVAALSPGADTRTGPAAAGPEMSDVVMTTLIRVSDRTPVPLATPVRSTDGPAGRQMVLAPARSVAAALAADRSGADRIITVQLVDGTTVLAEVVDDGAGGGLAMLEFVEPAETATFDLARRVPGPEGMVTVLTDRPVTVALGRVRDVGAADGTAIVDADGDLVGVCVDPSSADDGFVTIDGLLAGATTSSLPPPRR